MTMFNRLAENDLVGLAVLTNYVVSEVIEAHTGRQTCIKWQNDIMIDDKKLCGCLVRSANIVDDPDNHWSVQNGIGVNVKISPLETSTCMEKAAGKQLDLATIITDLIKAVFRLYLKIQKQGHGDYIPLIKKKMLYFGEKVKIYDLSLTKVEKEGVFEDITQEFYAMLRTEQGLQTIISGRMRK